MKIYDAIDDAVVCLDDRTVIAEGLPAFDAAMLAAKLTAKSMRRIMSFDEYFAAGGPPFPVELPAPPRINPECLGHRNGDECPPEFTCIAFFEAELESHRRERDRLSGPSVYPETQTCPRYSCSGLCKCKGEM